MAGVPFLVSIVLVLISLWIRVKLHESPEFAKMKEEGTTEPSLLAEIEYRAKPAEGKFRHPSFKGIREDL